MYIVKRRADKVSKKCIQAVDDADSDVHIGGTVGKAVPVVGLAGGASALWAAAHDVAAVGRTWRHWHSWSRERELELENFIFQGL